MAHDACGFKRIFLPLAFICQADAPLTPAARAAYNPAPMSYTRRRRICLAVLAWFAQLCLPLAHAAVMAERPVQLSSWCGDPAQVRAFIATLPPELRVEVQPDSAHVHNLSQCATLCALAVTPLLPAVMPGMVELAEDIFLKPVRKGTPLYSGALHDMVASPRSATVMGLLEEARLARMRGMKAAQQAGSVQSLFGRVRDWFVGNF